MPLFSEPILPSDLQISDKIKWKTNTLRRRAGFLIYNTTSLFLGRTQASYTGKMKYNNLLELSPFAGKQEIDEMPSQTAIRELREEVGDNLFNYLSENGTVVGYVRYVDNDNEYLLFILFIDTLPQIMSARFQSSKEFDEIVSIPLDGFGQAGLNPQGRLMLTEEYNLVKFYDNIVLSAYQLVMETLEETLEPPVEPQVEQPTLFEQIWSFIGNMWNYGLSDDDEYQIWIKKIDEEFD
jgi:hypothetical protein